MGVLDVMLQKGKMRLTRAFCTAISKSQIRRAMWPDWLCARMRPLSRRRAFSGSRGPVQPEITKSEKGKQEEAARAAARAKARHFDRVLIIVLENVDYDRAIRDPSLVALA